MEFDFKVFDSDQLDESFVEWLVEEQWPEIGSHFGRLWDYYYNPMFESAGLAGFDNTFNVSGRNYLQAQEYGLPARITGVVYPGAGGVLGGRRVSDIQRKEVVIENDIAWRINAMVDFLFGKSVKFISKASDPTKRREIEKIIKSVISANGDAEFLQDMAVLGSVYGFVDCLIRPGAHLFTHDPSYAGSRAVTNDTAAQPHFPSFESIVKLASSISLELIEAPRALPILDENNYRKINYYVQNYYQQKNKVSQSNGFISRLITGTNSTSQRNNCLITEVIGPEAWQRYVDGQLIAEGVNPFGTVPVVHIQNLAQPYYYEGISDVEQLIGLQDELNTRLSDRANRITYQTFKMYLAKGLESFEDKPVSPGRMWCTDNIDASIEEFGGDAETPGENAHIDEIREAMDKISGVTPVVAGILKNKIGNLTSGVALKMTFMGMLAKTNRKQFTYGRGITQICELILSLLDKSGVYKTNPEDRGIEVVFADPLPVDTTDKLNEMRIKKELGVSTETILSELGYE